MDNLFGRNPRKPVANTPGVNIFEKDKGRYGFVTGLMDMAANEPPQRDAAFNQTMGMKQGRFEDEMVANIKDQSWLEGLNPEQLVFSYQQIQLLLASDQRGLEGARNPRPGVSYNPIDYMENRVTEKQTVVSKLEDEFRRRGMELPAVNTRG